MAEQQERPAPVYPDSVLLAAGRVAATWFADTGDCLFCDVDRSPDKSHEKRCPLRIDQPPQGT